MYFRQFPVVSYLNFKNISKGYDLEVLARNILKRVSFSSSIKDEASLFYDYQLEDGETPDILADRIYGNSYYHWVLLLFNDIIDPYNEWPKGSVAVENFIDKKYPGQSMFLVHPHDGTGDNATMVGITFGKNETIFKTTGAFDEYGRYRHVTLGGTQGGSFAHYGLVNNWDRQYSRLDVRDIQGTFATGDYVGVGKPDGSFNFAMIMRITPNRKALHHFEEDYLTGVGVTLEGERTFLDPLAALSGAVLGHTGHTGEHSTTAVKFSETRLARYMGVAGSPSFANVVTNEEHEYNLNDDIKTIKVLKPEFLSPVLIEFQNILKDTVISPRR